MPLPRRHLFWRDIVAKAFPGMTAIAPEGIRADLARWRLGPVGLARARSGRAQVRREMNRDGHHVVLHLQRRGRLTMLHGDAAVSGGVGDILVADDSRPYTIDISDANDCLIVQVPADQLVDGIGLDALHGRLLPGQVPHVAFLNRMLLGLWDQRAMLDEVDDGVGGLLVDATRLVFRQQRNAPLAAGGAETPVAHALRHLNDPELGTASLCAATGLSPRAVQKAFLRETGLTPTAFVAERRLTHAAELLVTEPGRSVTDIAFTLGFNDAAFFSRCFRRRFGTTPREWRMAGARPS
ncbi:AraC family transcriptional regulator [Sphingomonadaceae bacterium jetA1]|uniref:AraC family transcriptional regulator n=1 Tax=Facivitalis istanbulensis TaxID=3075838 RepID=UPI00348F89A4